ncbi:hypothetical protein BHM03_00054502 [Ensete ventricosum]|nr:hypothetical protein BHM03_00054502 [Ensete ventricosum]
MVHYRPKTPQVLTRHTRIYKPKLATKQTKIRLFSLLQARFLMYKVRELGYLTSLILLVVEKASTAYCLLRSLVEHSCINPKSLTYGYLDEKPIDIGLMKFPALPPCLSTWSLPLHSPPPRHLLRPMLSLHESKRSMTPWKSRFCGTMVLPSP